VNKRVAIAEPAVALILLLDVVTSRVENLWWTYSFVDCFGHRLSIYRTTMRWSRLSMATKSSESVFFSLRQMQPRRLQSYCSQLDRLCRPI
jgi:hypothetical protein